MARRKGLSHDEVAHRWAQNTEGDHAAGFNMWFEGDTIYSYGRHFPIARLVTNEQGEKAVLFTTEVYGTSTAKHCTITRRAINHLKSQMHHNYMSAITVTSLAVVRGEEIRKGFAEAFELIRWVAQ